MFDCAQDRYSFEKVPANLDCIIVGSGIGGLYCGALLAKAGQKVLVLESHGIAGGCTHEFVKKGFHFDSGLHYVGNMEAEGKVLLDAVCKPEHKIRWQKQGTAENGYVYDEICLVGEKPFAFRAGKENLLQDLIRAFPHEERGIRAYFRQVERMGRSAKLYFMLKIAPEWAQRWLQPWLCREFLQASQRSALEVLSSLLTDKRLIAILLGQFGDHGVSPDQVSFSLHALVFAHYFRGGYYPVGGPQTLSRSLIPTIVEAGGRVLVKAAVEEILLCPNRPAALGVRLTNGDVITARDIISAAGIRNTYLKLISPDNIQKYHIPVEPFKALGPSVGHACTFIGLEGSAEELQLPSSNQWILPTAAPQFDLVGDVKKFVSDPLNPEQPMFAFVSFPSAKDPEGTLATNGPHKSTCIMITEAKFEWFNELAIPGSRKGKRGERYLEEKNRFQERLLNLLYSRFPQLVDKVKYVVSSTPLTSKHYLNALNGESYGLNMTKERFSADMGILTRPQVAQIAHLYLTGQDIVSAGISGAMMGGLLTAHAILGYGTFTDILTGRNLVKDILHIPQ